MRDGEQEPLGIEITMCRVRARTPTGGTGPDEVLFITRERLLEGAFQHGYYLSNTAANTTLQEFARVAKAEHRIEEAFTSARAKRS